MIDERTLTDPSRCPSCAAGLASSRCGTCGVELGGETGRALWTVSHQAAGLLARRQSLIATLRAEVGAVVPAATATRPVRPPELAEAAQTAAPTQSGLPVPPLPAVGGAPATPYAIGSRWSVSQLLLGLGAVLVGVAACTFLVVSWSLLGVGGRAAVLTGITALAVAASRLSARRGLRSTTEAMAVVAAALSLLDVWGAFRADLAGAGQVSGLLWWAGALGTVSAFALACAIVVPATTYRVAAAAFAQVAAMLIVHDVADRGSHPHAVWAVGLTLLTLATLATATAMPASWPQDAAGRWSWVACSGLPLGSRMLWRPLSARTARRSQVSWCCWRSPRWPSPRPCPWPVVCSPRPRCGRCFAGSAPRSWSSPPGPSSPLPSPTTNGAPCRRRSRRTSSCSPAVRFRGRTACRRAPWRWPQRCCRSSRRWTTSPPRSRTSGGRFPTSGAEPWS